MPQIGNDIIGQNIIIQLKNGDNINNLMQKYEVSYHELLEANPNVRFSNIKTGTTIVIPGQHILPTYREGIVINIPELRLYYFTPDHKLVFTTPVGLGRAGWRTPTLKTYVYRKEEDPTWHVPDSIAEYAYQSTGKILPEEVLPGPENPLGKYAIYLAAAGYLIHGTNDPTSVGKYYSSGCMRLYDYAIEFLYQQVTKGTPVYIVHYSEKVGWQHGTLYMESHIPVEYNIQQTATFNQNDLISIVNQTTRNHNIKIDWDKVRLVEKQHTGIPQPIGRDSAADDEIVE